MKRRDFVTGLLLTATTASTQAQQTLPGRWSPRETNCVPAKEFLLNLDPDFVQPYGCLASVVCLVQGIWLASVGPIASAPVCGAPSQSLTFDRGDRETNTRQSVFRPVLSGFQIDR
jgi:hypothetical protein